MKPRNPWVGGCAAAISSPLLRDFARVRVGAPKGALGRLMVTRAASLRISLNSIPLPRKLTVCVTKPQARTATAPAKTNILNCGIRDPKKRRSSQLTRRRETQTARLS